MFLDRNLILPTKRKIYQTCALLVILYALECWIPLRKHINLTSVDWDYPGSLTVSDEMGELTCRCEKEMGDEEYVAEMVRLEWLGHAARMSERRIHKSAFFGWLSQPRPPGDPRKH